MTLGLLRPLCPICGVRTQLLMKNGRRRGACPECWANRPGYTHDQAPEGSERIYRNVAQIKVGRRWVNKSRHLAKLAGVALEPDMRARMRDGVLEVSVWQAVGGDPVKGDPAAGVHRPGPGRDRKRKPRRGVFVDLTPEQEAWLGEHQYYLGGASRAVAMRDLAFPFWMNL